MSTNRTSTHDSNSRPAPGQQVLASAIVLRTRAYRDSDLIVHFLTPALGKISVLARHARSSRKRFPNSLDLFDRGTARLTTERSGAWGLAEFTSASSLVKVRQDLDKLTLASLICEVSDLILQEDDPAPAAAVFEVVDLSLNAVDEAADVRTALRSTFIGLANLCQRAGIADPSAATPGSRALQTLLDLVERHCDRPLLTRDSLKGVLDKASGEGRPIAVFKSPEG